MRYFYIPPVSWKRRGPYGLKRGGSYTPGNNGGYLVGCGRNGKIRSMKKLKKKVKPRLNFVEKSIIDNADITGKTAEIPKETFDLLSYLNDQGNFLKGKATDWGSKKMYDARIGLVNKVNPARNWVSSRYRAGKDWSLEQLHKGEAWAINKYNAGKTWVVDKYTRLKNWLANKLSGVSSWKGYLWSGMKDAAAAFYEIIRKVGEDLMRYMKTAGWGPIQIAMAINVLRYPPSIWEQLALKGVEQLPGVVAAVISALKTAGLVATAAGGAGYGGWYYNMGAGYRGVLKKGTPRAKARMAYLRSLRRR